MPHPGQALSAGKPWYGYLHRGQRSALRFTGLSLKAATKEASNVPLIQEIARRWLPSRSRHATTYAMQRNPRSLLPLACVLLSLTGCTAGGAGLGLSPTPGSEVFWAIRCDTRHGADRFRITQQESEALKQVQGLKPQLVQVIHNEHESSVYYGRYRRTVEIGGSTATYRPDAMADLNLIRSLCMNVGGSDCWPFIYASLEELPSGRSRHPEWDLANAKGYWTLHVAVFYCEGPITNPKYLAEEYCRELREQGVEAYYYHGPTRSSVYVGLFPKEAIQTVSETNPLSGVLTVSNKIVDQRLLKLQEQFPVSYQNGRRVNELVSDPATGQKKRLPFESFVVQVPSAAKTDRPRAKYE
jgi:hypothetical protein